MSQQIEMLLPGLAGYHYEPRPIRFLGRQHYPVWLERNWMLRERSVSGCNG